MDGLLQKIRATQEREPREGMHFCEECGREVYHDDTLWDAEGCTYGECCAAECTWCELVFLKTQLVDGVCVECREGDPDE